MKKITGHSVETMRNYIRDKLSCAFEDGADYVDIVSGDVHQELGLKNSMPMVCGAMYSLKNLRDEILSTTPSGFSSTIKIRYYRPESE